MAKLRLIINQSGPWSEVSTWKSLLRIKYENVPNFRVNWMKKKVNTHPADFWWLFKNAEWPYLSSVEEWNLVMFGLGLHGLMSKYTEIVTSIYAVFALKITIQDIQMRYLWITKNQRTRKFRCKNCKKNKTTTKFSSSFSDIIFLTISIESFMHVMKER